jgi:hypothetical protein
MKILGSKLTYANVMSSAAVFLVLAGGTAIAANQMLPKNSVGTKQIKANSITGAKIKNGAVSGAKVDVGSLGTVPGAAHATSADSATRADSAAHATTADSATHATTADSADHAGSADRADSADHAESAAVAADADTLDGRPSSGFQSAGSLLSGSGSLTVHSPQTVIDIPNGPDITTSGAGTGAFEVDLANPDTGSGAENWGLYSAPTSTVVPPGGRGGFAVPDLSVNIVAVNAALTRSFDATCVRSPEIRLYCSGTLYEAE